MSNKPETITIDDVKYVRADAAPQPPGSIQIAVLDRGFVYVGRVELDEQFVTLRNAKNIRAWGTKAGLGELVEGPLPATKLDPVGTVRAPLRALISLIDVEQSKWNAI